MTAERVYISVPMLGYPTQNLELARMIEQTVNSMGAVSVIPHDIHPWDHPETDCPPGFVNGEHAVGCYLRTDLLEMLECDSVVFGPNWEHSVGCRLEMSVATHVGMPVYWFDPADASINTTKNTVIERF